MRVRSVGEVRPYNPVSKLAYADLLHARERVRGALEPHLGPAHALERANNITQALSLTAAEPERVAFDMLRQLPERQRQRVARIVRREWLTTLAGAG